jgi:SAM-dependent methyltransferase
VSGAVDFGRTARDYAEHRPGLPEADFDRLRALGIGRAGQRVLDLGTGTGQAARGLAAPGLGIAGLRVIGLDPALALLLAGVELDRRAGLAPLGRVRATAERLPFAAGAFDALVACQCWHWLDAPRAAAEARRVLAPGGRIALVQFDWLPLAGNVVAATEALILKHNPSWALGGGDGRYPARAAELAAAGFRDVLQEERDVDVPFPHAGWRGRIRASAGVAATLDAAAVERFDAEHAALLAERFPSDPLPVPHRVHLTVATR